MIKHLVAACCLVAASCTVHDTVAREISVTVEEARGLCACDGVVGTNSSVLSVTGDLRSGGDFAGMLDVEVTGDAFIDGELSANNLSVTGTLRMPVGARRVVTGDVNVSRGLTDTVDIGAVCHCERDQQRDIASLVDAARTSNDNATIDLGPDFLLNAQSPITLMLPCGRFYLDGITGAANIVIVTTDAGGASLVVGGDVAAEASLTIAAQAGALELVVAGNVTVTGAWNAGSETQLVRVLVGGGGTLDLGGSAEVGGLLYAPNVELVARDSLQVWGPLFVRRLTSEGDVFVYDGMDSEVPIAVCP